MNIKSTQHTTLYTSLVVHNFTLHWLCPIIQGETHKVLQSDSTQTIDHIQKCFRQKFQYSKRPSYWTTLFFYRWRRWSYVKVNSTFLRRLGSRMKMIKNFWNFHNPLINIKGKSRKNFKRIENAVFEKINVKIVLLYMGSYGRKLKSINLPSIFLLKMINSLEAQLQYELWIFLNILKQKNVHLQCSYLDNWTWRKYIRCFGANGQPSSRSVATLR